MPGLPPVSFAIVGEPTEMQPAIAEKGLMVLDVTATGKAGHAARNEGDNAIYKVLDDIAWFRDYRFEKESPLLCTGIDDTIFARGVRAHARSGTGKAVRREKKVPWR